MERPAAIIWFERLYLASLAIGLAPLVMEWDETIAGVPEPWMVNLVIGAVAVGTVINLLLWHFIARRRSNVAKWIAVVFFAISIPAIAAQIAQEGMMKPGVVLTIGSTLLGLVALALLFSRQARAWFQGRATTSEVADAFR